MSLRLSTKEYVVRLVGFGVEASYEKDGETRVISWNPHCAMKTSEGGRMSPALILGHEMDHANAEHMNMASTGDLYDNYEERRVITGSETAAAIELGEDYRTDHRGWEYPVASPDSRIDSREKRQ